VFVGQRRAATTFRDSGGGSWYARRSPCPSPRLHGHGSTNTLVVKNQHLSHKPRRAGSPFPVAASPQCGRVGAMGCGVERLGAGL
jgi:hypothetical protein